MIILIRLDTMNATQWKGGSRKGKPAFLRHCFAAPRVSLYFGLLMIMMRMMIMMIKDLFIGRGEEG